MTHNFTNFTEVEGGTESHTDDELSDTQFGDVRSTTKGNKYQETSAPPEVTYDGRVFLEQSMPGECRIEASTHENPAA